MQHYDLVIAGGGLVGGSLACALTGCGLRIAVVEAVPAAAVHQPSYDERVIALSWGSRLIFEAIGLWPMIAPEAEPIRRVHVSDRGHWGKVRIDPAELGVEALGYVVPARAMGVAIRARLEGAADISLLCPARLLGHSVLNDRVECEIAQEGGSRKLSGALLVAADGGDSAVRERYSLKVKEERYAQDAVITTVTPERPQPGVAYERFTDTGPLALLPMTEGRYSVVWTCLSEQAEELLGLSDGAFLARLQQRFGFRLGRFTQVGARRAYPLRLVLTHDPVRERVVLIGNAAHTLHPVAGQGFNLGLRDAAALADAIRQGVRAGADLGGAAILSDYRALRGDDQPSTARLTDLLARLFVSDWGPLLGTRNLAMFALDLTPAARRRLALRFMGLDGRRARAAYGVGSQISQPGALPPGLVDARLTGERTPRLLDAPPSSGSDGNAARASGMGSAVVPDTEKTLQGSREAGVETRVEAETGTSGATRSASGAEVNFDLVVVGGGMVGAALACACAGWGLSIAVIETRPPRRTWPAGESDLRVSALSRASQRLLDRLGVWERMRTLGVSPYRRMHVWDAVGGGSIGFDAQELGQPDLGHIVENRVTQLALWERMERMAELTFFCPASIADIDYSEQGTRVALDDGRHLRARLLVAADGRDSLVRTRVGIETEGWEYDQRAIVATVRPAQWHQETAWQRFLPTGPLALLPLADGRCSIVWSATAERAADLLAMDDRAFSEALTDASEGRLGRLDVESLRGAFSLRLQHAKRYVLPGLALIGDAAHAVHPLAGQGVNLGFLDAVALADAIRRAIERDRDVAGLWALRHYERARRGDNLAMLVAMDLIKRLLISVSLIISHAISTE